MTEKVKARLAAFSQFFRSKRSRNALFLLCTFVILGFYTFFFTSKSTLPATGDVDPSPLYTVEEFERGHTAELIRWDYDPAQQLMEVELTFTNELFDGNEDYSFSVRSRKGGTRRRLRTEVVNDDLDMYVVQIADVPSEFDAISFTVSCSGLDGSARFYADSDAYTAEIKTRSAEEYRQLRLERTVENHEAQIATLRETIREHEETMLQVEIAIQRLQANKQYETAEEQAATDATIGKYQKEWESLVAENETLEKEIQEYLDKIQILNQQIGAVAP